MKIKQFVATDLDGHVDIWFNPSNGILKIVGAGWEGGAPWIRLSMEAPKYHWGVTARDALSQTLLDVKDHRIGDGATSARSLAEKVAAGLAESGFVLAQLPRRL